MTETKAPDKAAQARKKSADDQAKAAGPLSVRDDVNDTPTTSEILADDKHKVFGDNPALQYQGVQLTADQAAVANGGEPIHKPAKSEGKQIEIGDRVLLHTATPISGQTITPSLVIGFTPLGLANLRIEFTDGARGRPLEFGGVPQNEAQEERGAYWTWPEDTASQKDK